MVYRCLTALALVSTVATLPLGSQTGPGIQQPPVKSELLDNLVGVWSYEAPAGGRPVRGGADAVWEMGHQWLRLHQKEVAGPESVTYIGFDNYDRRFVAIRLDSISGARGAETNGYGEQDGNKIAFTFDYSTTQIRQTLTWDPAARSWQFLVESKARRATSWTVLQTLTLRRFGARGIPGVLRTPSPHVPVPSSPQ